MATHRIRTRDTDSLTQFLGWFSIGLGTARLLAPGTLCRFVGASGRGASRTVMRLMGVRELTQGVGGDGLDLSLLLLTAAKNRRARTAFAIANVVAVAVPDVMGSLDLSRRKGEPREGTLVRKAATINRPREEVEEAWSGAGDLREKVMDAHAQVSFADAPGGPGH